MATGRIGVTPTLGTRWSKAPAGGTTSLSGLDDNSVALVYSVGYEQVYRNGVLLSRGNDYTATTGNSITLTDATIAGDIIEVFANELVPLTDAISKGQFTAKGALLSATAASTPGVLTVGSNDQVLTADSSTATGLKWATPVSGSMTLLSTTTLSGNSTTISSIPQTYTNLYILYYNVTCNIQDLFYCEPNANSSITYVAEALAGAVQGTSNPVVGRAPTSASAPRAGSVIFYNYADTTTGKPCHYLAGHFSNTSDIRHIGGTVYTTSAITSVRFRCDDPGRNFTGGTVKIYGVN